MSIAQRPLGKVVPPEWEVRQPRLEQLLDADDNLRTVAFRASDALIALLQRDPAATWLFMVRTPSYPAGGVIQSQPGLGGPSIGRPTDIAGVTPEGLAWYLDSRTGRVTSQDVGGQRTGITNVGTRGTVRRACRLTDSTIAYLDDARPARAFIQATGLPFVSHELALPNRLAAGKRDWGTLRFGGSPDAPCVAWAPSLASVLVLTDSGVRVLGSFVEPPVRESTAARVARWFTRSPPVPNALDVTSFPGGVAVLHGGRSAFAGRLVDLYRLTGEYVETIRLPRLGIRVAGSRYRLFVLSKEARRVYLASYVLPAGMRGELRDGGATPFVPHISAIDSTAQGGFDSVGVRHR
jgi:hypothetical protein